ncbi:hypothetical protein HK414_03040 [Ramlibacter terrae]|uniref:Uncharacterized protein n=1 Tax=Ramlibacter terrae TaxID=2732511 RepID=A0ABX6P0C8_9BURK|nr:hypothetical protein HK414_03040 [Ramlibacter terrae]
MASITGNLLVYTPALNANGNGAASFTFRCRTPAAPPTAASTSTPPRTPSRST